MTELETNAELDGIDREVWGNVIPRLDDCLGRIHREMGEVLVDVVEDETGDSDDSPKGRRPYTRAKDASQILSQCLGPGGELGIYPSYNRTDSCFKRYIVLCTYSTFSRRAVGIEGIIARCLARHTTTDGVMFVDLTQPDDDSAGDRFGRGSLPRDVLDTLKTLQVKSVLFRGHVTKHVPKRVPGWIHPT